MKTSSRIFVSLVLLGAMLWTPALAADREVLWDDVYCFSQADFSQEAGLDGIMLTSVPDDSLGTLYLGSRALRSGDALTAEQLEELTFSPAGTLEGDAVISCLALSPEGGTQEAELTLKIGSGKNDPPVAEDSEFTTYKNIPGQVPLTVSDPEGEPLTVTITQAPKRGAVAVSEDGTVTYTPKENKVGKDTFSYTVTDPAGNTSNEATVRIVIEKPSDKQTYSDLEGDEALLAATWLREEGIYQGEIISGELLFQPDETVTRGEFIAMCVALTGRDEDAEALSTGFADEAETPTWLSPYVSTALRCGYLTGLPSEEGLTLQASSPITQAEAAKMVSALLSLPEENSQAVMALEDGIPTWAAGAASAVETANVFEVSDAGAPLTRREAALLLHRTAQQAQREDYSLLSWAKK